jgi:hypothetical protein
VLWCLQMSEPRTQLGLTRLDMREYEGDKSCVALAEQDANLTRVHVLSTQVSITDGVRSGVSEALRRRQKTRSVTCGFRCFRLWYALYFFVFFTASLSRRSSLAFIL